MGRTESIKSESKELDVSLLLVREIERRVCRVSCVVCRAFVCVVFVVFYESLRVCA